MYELVAALGRMMTGRYAQAIDRTAFCCLGGVLTMVLSTIGAWALNLLQASQWWKALIQRRREERGT